MKADIFEINAKTASVADFAALADGEYACRIEETAREIYAQRIQRPIVLLSGPSGSGKTTTAMAIERFLDSWGCETHTLSMDNYFKSLTEEEFILAKKGQLDLESPTRVDIPFLNAQLQDIFDCKSVELPKYDFLASKRGNSGHILTRKPGELVILEGIHALNPEVITIGDDKTSRVYVSVQTEVKCGNVLLPPEKIRLLRRMTRDSLFRNRGFDETVTMFKSVQRGERLFVAPYSHRAMHSIDTFHATELGVYKKLLLEQLEAMGHIPELDELLTVLQAAEPIDENLLSPHSLVREFIGHSQFEY
ncbi:MAG: adenylyl-sulfate kinase [Oscillospiraceae bacterium]|nr:adenylyl-sulfate kinase [Oscillospiraceae bacterium]